MVVKFVKKTLLVIDSFACRLMRKRKVLFHVENQIGLFQQLPIIRALADNKRLNIYVSVHKDINIDRKVFDEICSDIRFISERTSCRMRFSCILATDIYLNWNVRRSPTLIMSHGAGIGNSHRQQVNWVVHMWKAPGSNGCAINSRAEYDHLMNFHPELIEDKKKMFFLGGLLKLNIGSQSQSGSVSSEFGLSNNVKTIVIFSHYNTHSFLRNIPATVFSSILSAFPDLQIVITGHPKLWEDHISSSDTSNNQTIYEQMNKLAANEPRLFFYDKPATTKIMAIADAFVSDYSSVRVEIAKWDKPVFIYNHDDFEYQNEVTGRMFLGASYSFADETKIIEYIKLWLENGLPQTAVTNKELFNYFSHDAEHALQRYVNIVNKLTEVRALDSKKWVSLRESSISELKNTFESGRSL